MKKSLTQRIKDYLDKKGEWTCGGEVQKLAMQAGYEAQNAGRRCRELVESGDLEVEYRKGQKTREIAFYRSTRPLKKVNYYANGRLVDTRWE